MITNKGQVLRISIGAIVLTIGAMIATRDSDNSYTENILLATSTGVTGGVIADFNGFIIGRAVCANSEWYGGECSPYSMLTAVILGGLQGGLQGALGDAILGDDNA